MMARYRFMLSPVLHGFACLACCLSLPTLVGIDFL